MIVCIAAETVVLPSAKWSKGYIRLTNCSAEEVIELLTEVQRIVTAQPRKSVLTLGDFTGAQFSRGAVTRMKEVVRISGSRSTQPPKWLTKRWERDSSCWC